MQEFDIRMLPSPSPAPGARGFGPALTSSDLSIAGARDMFLRARLDNKHQPLMDRVMCAFAVDHQRFEAFGKWALANAPALGIVPGPDDSDLLAGSRLLNWLPTTHLTEDTAQSYAFILYHLAEGLEGRLERLRIQPILEALWGNRPHTH